MHPKVTVIDHPLMQHKLTILRSADTTTDNFRRVMREIAAMMAYELTRDLPTEKVAVRTPVAECEAPVIAGKKLCLVSILRAGPQAARLRILVDGRERLAELVADGALLCTPAGSTAYNYSAHGPILPIEADILALTPMAAFRPRRWRGALLPKSAQVTFEVLEPAKRPVSAVADSAEVRDAVRIEIESVRDIEHHLLFDPGHGLEERLIREQFV